MLTYMVSVLGCGGSVSVKVYGECVGVWRECEC